MSRIATLLNHFNDMHRDILAENELTLDFSLVIDVIVMSLNLLDTVIKEKPEKGKLIRMSEW